MKSRWGITAIALATTLAAATVARAEDTPGAQKVALSIPNTECARCVAAMSASVKADKGVKSIAGFTPDSKKVVIELNPRATSVQKLAQEVADTPGLHGKPYEAALILQVDDLGNAETRKKVDEALKGVKGIDSAVVVDETAGLIGVKFTKLAASEGMGAQLEPILQALSTAGVKATNPA
jgi:copper chaperone CopZ